VCRTVDPSWRQCPPGSRRLGLMVRPMAVWQVVWFDWLGLLWRRSQPSGHGAAAVVPCHGFSASQLSFLWMWCNGVPTDGINCWGFAWPPTLARG
jgi:hypothetical protein